MRNDVAETIAEAEAQAFVVPTYEYWLQFAHLLDGYAICEELGLRWQDWREQQLRQFTSASDSTNVLEARLLLFFEARAKRFTDGPEPYARINALLQRIAQQTGQAYTPLTREAIEQRAQADNDALMGNVQAD